MMIQRKGFVWCLLHGDDIDQSICNAGVSIADAFDRFNVSTILEISFSCQKRLCCTEAILKLILPPEGRESIQELASGCPSILAAG